MRKLNNVLIFLASLTSVCFAVYNINVGAYDRLLACLSIVFVLFIPRIINKIFKNKINDAMEFVYVVFIILAQLLGSVVNLYDGVWWYDLFTHFLSGILTSVFALVIMDWFGVYKEKNKVFNALFMLCFTLAAACFWEFLEFGSFVFFGMDVQHHLTTGVFDTMEDMLVAFAGGIVVVVSYLLESKVSKSGFVKKVVSNLK